MTRREVSSQLFEVMNSRHSQTIPVTYSTDFIEAAKGELLQAINSWNSGGTSDSVKGALFLFQTAGAIDEKELEDLMTLVDSAQ